MTFMRSAPSLVTSYTVACKSPSHSDHKSAYSTCTQHPVDPIKCLYPSSIYPVLYRSRHVRMPQPFYLPCGVIWLFVLFQTCKNATILVLFTLLSVSNFDLKLCPCRIIRKTRGREGQRRRFGDLRPSPIDFSSNFSLETTTYIDIEYQI